MINAQLTLLLEIQDLKAKLKELRAGSDLGALERETFGIDLDEAASQLETRVEELEGQLKGE